MKRISRSTLLAAGASAACLFASIPFTAGRAAVEASPIYGVTIPDGYRQWEVVAPSEELGKLDELRVILGNPIAIATYRKGTLPFPDGTILVKVGWKRQPSAVDDAALGSPQAFVPGVRSEVADVQIMVKDSKKYASTAGWGFGKFLDGKPLDKATHEACFTCHAAHVASHDFVFTRYAR
jgi:Cytochrome P460